MHCYVRNCPNGPNNSKNDDSDLTKYFPAPEEPTLLGKWKRVIPRSEFFCRNDKLCDSHFLNSEVLWFTETKLPNGNVRRLLRDKPILKPGTIPSIFPPERVERVTPKPILKTPNQSSKDRSKSVRISNNVETSVIKEENETPKSCSGRIPNRDNTTSSEKRNPPRAKRRSTIYDDYVTDDELNKAVQLNRSNLSLQPSKKRKCEKSELQPVIRLVPLESLIDKKVSKTKTYPKPPSSKPTTEQIDHELKKIIEIPLLTRMRPKKPISVRTRDANPLRKYVNTHRLRSGVLKPSSSSYDISSGQVANSGETSDGECFREIKTEMPDIEEELARMEMDTDNEDVKPELIIATNINSETVDDNVVVKIEEEESCSANNIDISFSDNITIKIEEGEEEAADEVSCNTIAIESVSSIEGISDQTPEEGNQQIGSVGDLSSSPIPREPNIVEKPTSSAEPPSPIVESNSTTDVETVKDSIATSHETIYTVEKIPVSTKETIDMGEGVTLMSDQISAATEVITFSSDELFTLSEKSSTCQEKQSSPCKEPSVLPEIPRISFEDQIVNPEETKIISDKPSVPSEEPSVEQSASVERIMFLEEQNIPSEGPSATPEESSILSEVVSADTEESSLTSKGISAVLKESSNLSEGVGSIQESCIPSEVVSTDTGESSVSSEEVFADIGESSVRSEEVTAVPEESSNYSEGIDTATKDFNDSFEVVGTVPKESSIPSEVVSADTEESCLPSEEVSDVPENSNNLSEGVCTAPKESSIPSEVLTTDTGESSFPSEEVRAVAEESTNPSEVVDDAPNESTIPSEGLGAISEESSNHPEVLGSVSKESTIPSEVVSGDTEESSLPSEEVSAVPEKSYNPSEGIEEPNVLKPEESQEVITGSRKIVDGSNIEESLPEIGDVHDADSSSNEVEIILDEKSNESYQTSGGTCDETAMEIDGPFDSSNIQQMEVENEIIDIEDEVARLDSIAKEPEKSSTKVVKENVINTLISMVDENGLSQKKRKVQEAIQNKEIIIRDAGELTEKGGIVQDLFSPETIQEILNQIKLPLTSPVTLRIAPLLNKEAKTPLVNKETIKNKPGKKRKYNQTKSLSTAGSSKGPIPTNISEFQNLIKTRTVFDFPTYVSEIDDDVEYWKMCQLIRESFRELIETRNTKTSIGKLTVKFALKSPPLAEVNLETDGDCSEPDNC